MAVVNSDLPGRDAPAARLLSRVADGRWLIAVVAGLLLVLAVAGAIEIPAGVAVLAAVVGAVVLVPRGAADGAPTVPATVTTTVERDPVFKLFSDALPDPCFILDRRGIVRYANERAVAMFQIRVGEALTFRLRVPDLIAAFDRVIRGGAPVRVEFAERVPTERWFAAWFARLEGRDLILLLVDDLSEQKTTDRVRVDFVANASHELRTPLASLAGFIETLQGPARDDVAARTRFLTIMREQAERMSRLVNDLLSLSRIEMKAHVRPSDRVDMVAVVRHVVDSLEPLARDLGVTIETEVPATAVEVTGDRDELIQVFENLVENACKYGQAGKRVAVTIASPKEGIGAQVAIRDFGPGIPEEHLPRLTERFYRVDVEDSRRHRGTGLGLAIVKHIVARHLGRLTVVSRLGEGATFTVTFPVALTGRIAGAGENSETDQALAAS
jgi:two-component system, OmpR family, phosphate regulon sensor histidine kinase PhoR